MRGLCTIPVYKTEAQRSGFGFERRLKPEEELAFYSSGRAWQRQRHIYIDPFYYIDYCLAQTVSLEFWVLLRHDRSEAWGKYMAYTRPLIIL